MHKSDHPTKIELLANDSNGQLVKLLNYIRHNGNGGHTFTIIVDPDLKENTRKFGWDGDGSDRIDKITVNGEILKSLDYGQVMSPRLQGDSTMDEDDKKEGEGGLEKGSDSNFVLSALKDETEGMNAYGQALERVADPKLKEILRAIAEDEQKHNAALEQWLKENDPEALNQHEGEETADQETLGDDGAADAGASEDDTEKDGAAQELADDIQEVIEEHVGEAEKGESTESDSENEADEVDTEKCNDPFKKYVHIIKGDQQIVYGVVSEPDTVDLQGDRLSKAEIRKACHKFMVESQRIGKEHEGPAKADIIESYIAPVDFKCNDQVVKVGSWVMAVKIHDPQLWDAVKKGEITGFSIAGSGTRTPF